MKASKWILNKGVFLTQASFLKAVLLENSKIVCYHLVKLFLKT